MEEVQPVVEEVQVTEPSKTQKVAVVVANVAVTVTVSVLAGVVTNFINQKVDALIIPDKKK